MRTGPATPPPLRQRRACPGESPLQNLSTEITSNVPLTTTLVRHPKRQQWGRALCLWEREGKRGYQFEDGSVRVFAEGYYHLLAPLAQAPEPGLRRRLTALAPVVVTETGSGATAKRAPTPSLVDQVQYFGEEFTDGLAGSTWTEQHRGRAKGRALKRHRDAAIALAAKTLGEDDLRALIAAGNYVEVRDRTVALLRSTDLVTKTQLTALAKTSFSAELATAWVDYLHGPADDAVTFSAVRLHLGKAGLKKPSWSLFTGPRALLYPKQHVVVKRSVFTKQSQAMQIPFKGKTTPCHEGYVAYLQMATAIHDLLVEQGQAPRDLLDVAGFIWMTKRPAAQERLAAIMDNRKAEAEAEAEAAKPVEPKAPIASTSTDA